MFNADDDDKDNDEINGQTFTLDDVFNDTFNPKLFYAQWISGKSIVSFCVRHFPYMCTGYRTTQNSGRVNVWQVKAPVIYILSPKSTIPLYVYYLPKLYLSEFVLQKCWQLVLAPLKLNLSIQCISICYLELQ